MVMLTHRRCAAALNGFPDGSSVDFAKLLEEGHITKANKSRDIYKVVGGPSTEEGEEAVTALTAKNLVVSAHAFTRSAREAIEAAGGTCVVLSPTRNIPIEQAEADKLALDASRHAKWKELKKLKEARDAAKEAAKV
jgi:large subunit ribosomal protein L15